MDMLINVLGGLAACLTAFANVPQVLKCFRTGKAGDLSLKMLLALALGFTLWLIYGLMRGDGIIVAANAVSLALAVTLLVFKMRDRQSAEQG